MKRRKKKRDMRYRKALSLYKDSPDDESLLVTATDRDLLPLEIVQKLRREAIRQVDGKKFVLVSF